MDKKHREKNSMQLESLKKRNQMLEDDKLVMLEPIKRFRVRKLKSTHWRALSCAMYHYTRMVNNEMYPTKFIEFSSHY